MSGQYKTIPEYPLFIPLNLEHKKEMQPRLSLLNDGISEFTFSNLYLFRYRYQYCVAAAPAGGIIISGKNPADGSKFFMIPCVYPGDETITELFKTHNYWKNIPQSMLGMLNGPNITISEDRDNFDYLYLRSELAELSGKKFHKKKNLVNAFNYAWPNHEERVLEPSLIPDAERVLENWKKEKGDDVDYNPSRESLERFSVFNMRGAIYYVNGKPVAYCLGESIAGATIFCIHFEKALEQYKGIYQYMNQAFAASLEPNFIYINREQDLGNEGLRQAKMTYRPVRFVKKFKGVRV